MESQWRAIYNKGYTIKKGTIHLYLFLFLSELASFDFAN